MTMDLEVGMEFSLSERIKDSYFSAEALSIVHVSEKSVQFILKEGKGRGSMPIQHLNYMVKKKDLVKVKEIGNRRRQLEKELSEGEEQIS